MRTLGESLIDWLEAYGVDTVFGIPGVHTVELYRGLAASGIAHVTPRHEQGAGFMADGHARATGRVAAAFVITGPGLTNILTPMAQAYADSIPMLVVSSVNSTEVAGLGGDLHEIRNQGLIAAQAAAFSHTITDPAQLPRVLARAWAVFSGARPRPVHIQIPVDLLAAPAASPPAGRPVAVAPPGADPSRAADAMRMLETATAPLILAGGGALGAAGPVAAIARHLGAPVVCTTNARGLLAPDDPLLIPASPSLNAVRALISASDAVLAIGTELGRTDYDVHDRGGPDYPGQVIRIDIDPEQASSRGTCLTGDAGAVLGALLARADAPDGDRAARGADRAGQARRAAWDEIGEDYRRVVGFLETVRDTLPGTPIICDSTQAAYAGNLFFAPDGPRQWFNAATGYGALGYGLPAAIGAAHGSGRPVVCIAGDGGLQFSLTDLGTAVEERLPVILLVWNNRGYGEIKQFMLDRQIIPVGVDLHTPDFVAIGRAYGAEALRLDRPDDLPDQLRGAAGRAGPTLIEIDEALVLGGA